MTRPRIPSDTDEPAWPTGRQGERAPRASSFYQSHPVASDRAEAVVVGSSCGQCRAFVPRGLRGRPRLYCSRKCKDQAYRGRKQVRNVGYTVEGGSLPRAVAITPPKDDLAAGMRVQAP